MKYQNEIIKSIYINKKALGLKKILSVKLKSLGQGENNTNILAVINKKQKMVFRIGIRQELESNMKREYLGLLLLPKGIGPKPIFFDNSRRLIKKPYIIEEFVEGRHIKIWNKKHLALHAKTLAKLHSKKYSYWGKPGEKKRIFDLYKKAKKQIADWEKDNAEFFKDPKIASLKQQVLDFIKENNNYFTSLRRFSITHTDLILQNIIEKDNKLRYIDWEWISIRDNAEDLIMLYDIDLEWYPWKIKLSIENEKYYINTYLKYHPDKTLKERIHVWMEYSRFLDMTYFDWKIRNFHKESSTLKKSVYINCRNKIRKALLKRFKTN